MVKTLNISADIPADRELRIVLPHDFPSGPAEIMLVVSSASPAPSSTLGAFLNSVYFGMWRDRADITDNVEFARTLRNEGWKRL
jgi:hypothetical protein